MSNKNIIVSVAALFLPVLASAQVQIQTGNSPVEQLLGRVIGWIDTAIPVLISIATIVFIITVIQLMREKEASKLADRRKIVFNALGGLLVIVAVWGIISLVTNSFGVRTGPLRSGEIPCPPGMSYSTTFRRCV